MNQVFNSEAWDKKLSARKPTRYVVFLKKHELKKGCINIQHIKKLTKRAIPVVRPMAGE